MLNRFEEIDHTADVGIRVTASSLEDLCIVAARGMLHLMLEDAGMIGGETDRTRNLLITVAGEGPEELLHAWLSELHFQMTVRRSFPADFDVQTCTPSELRVRVGFVPLTREIAAAATEIKAVTWHGLTVEQAKDGWQAQVIFDT